jgi:hypothetical protein
MGLDYIRAQTGKPWRKRWDNGLDRLKVPTLFDLSITEAFRAVTATINPVAGARAGDILIIQSTCDGLVLSNGLRSIGYVDSPTSEISAAVRDCGGYARGEVRRVGLFGDTAEIIVR